MTSVDEEDVALIGDPALNEFGFDVDRSQHTRFIEPLRFWPSGRLGLRKRKRYSTAVLIYDIAESKHVRFYRNKENGSQLDFRPTQVEHGAILPAEDTFASTTKCESSR